MPEVTIRGAEPNDHARVVAVVDDWWGGRPMAAMLPRLFFEHFGDTSFVAENDGELAGFLCGFLSQSEAHAAYVHFVGVAPTMRGSGLARTLYECFFEVARAHGRDVVQAVTSPVNTTSVAFHRAMGFEVREPVPGYDGPGEDRVRLTKRLT
jgi:ribosomal protein S18 acetylase RimI-like enzyme